jgi:hypothetical protein
VPHIRAELADSYGIAVSPDLIEDYLKRYQAIVAARESGLESPADAYREVKDLVLTIDGLQPEKGHETLYVVREFEAPTRMVCDPAALERGVGGQAGGVRHRHRRSLRWGPASLL